MRISKNSFGNLRTHQSVNFLCKFSKNIAQILDKYCDIVLVGDSLGNALYGMKNTHSVTKEMMINHAISVKKGLSKALCVVDMPKNTYNAKPFLVPSPSSYPP